MDRKTKYGRMASNCSIRKCGTQKQDIGMTGGRKEGRDTENHRKKKKKIFRKMLLYVYTTELAPFASTS